MCDESRKAELFDWLMTQMRPSYRINDRAVWALPVKLLNTHPTKTPQEAIQKAFSEYKAWQANNLQQSPQPLLGDRE